MTEQEAYQEHIRYAHDTYCRIVIRHSSFDAARMLAGGVALIGTTLVPLLSGLFG